jgi:serine/threonine protein kinase, bacterial
MTAGRSGVAASAPGERIGQYTIHEELGHGPLGAVFRAVGPAGEVALKILHPELAADPAYRRRFEREGEVATGVRHPHLVPVVDHGEADGIPYLAAPFLRGGSLAARLDRGPLAVVELVSVVGQVASGLDALHRLGLLHRDVKPSNVMLAEDGAAALADFGLARTEAHTVLTHEGRVAGTADYVAPEAIRGDRPGPRSDVYALGCLAYACATGAPPFARTRTVAETCRAHLFEPPPDPAAARADLPRPFADALVTALAKEPERRPATGTAYALLLRAGARGA